MNTFDSDNHSQINGYANQSGSGFFDNIYSRALNLLPSSDASGRKTFPGERHSPLILKNGKVGVANFVGPGTQVLKRLRRGDPGRTPVDMTAKRHDIDYSLAQNSSTKSEQIKKVRAADNRMIKSLNRIQKAKSDSPLNIKVGKLIAVKMAGEDLGIASKGSFGGPLVPDMLQNDLDTLNDAKDKLTQKGYGIKLPGADLKKQLLRKYGKKGKKQKGGSVDVIAAVVPHLAKTLGIQTLSKESVKRLLKPVVSGNNIVSNIKQISKALLPILVTHKLKSENVKPTAKLVKKILKGSNKDLLKNLTGVVAQILKQVNSGQAGKGLSGSGTFWDDFGRGFLSVMKPALPILSSAALAIGQPEIGVPLMVASAIVNKL